MRPRLANFAKYGALLALASVPTAAAAADPRLLIDDPAVLMAVEAAGAAFPARLGALATLDNQALILQSSAYRSVAADLTKSIEQLAHGDPLLAPGMARSHRLFDKGWLAGSGVRYELAAVVNRLDRMPFAPEHCGELRLIYRLHYTTKTNGQPLTSRLPMTINLVSWQGDGTGGSDGRGGANCQAVAKLWSQAAGRSGPALATWLTSAAGPLRPSALALSQLKSLEVNVQSVRWPSTIRPDLGAHAEYLLRVYRYDAARKAFAPDKLENTPDVEGLLADRARFARFKAWLAAPANRARIDLGTAVLPAEFLATQATSVSPRGLTRLANRPFSRLLTLTDAAAIAGPDVAKGRYVRSPAALLRRLDDLACVGCHEGRSVAGFHVLGVDRADTPPVNAIAIIGSPHLLLDQPRRLAYLEATAGGAAADPARPLSERADAGEGGYGSHCGLGDAGFTKWSCAAGLTCKGLSVMTGDHTVGQCFPAASPEVGDPCETGVMVPHPDGRRDRIVDARSSSCGPGVCEVNEVGFPDGMCAVACDSGPPARCGGIAILASFNACLGHGRPYTECLEHNVRPAGLRACGADLPCRDDYLCARAAGDGAAGVCIPPYFLFQMRVDGHPPARR